MPTQKILYIDMDDVLCDYTSAFQIIKDQQSDVEFPQSVPGFFENLKPMNNAVNSFLDLASHFDVHILSAPSVFNPLCYTEKMMLGTPYGHDRSLY